MLKADCIHNHIFIRIPICLSLYLGCVMIEMDDMKDFDVSELKISSDGIKEYDTGKPSTIKKRREFSLEDSRKSALRKSPFRFPNYS